MSGLFIELDRRFEEDRTDETPESQAERSYMDGWLGRERGIVWDELLKHRLVVVLGEPGSGKTEELKAQYRHLRTTTTSFFLPLDQLVNKEVNSILDENETRLFKKWKNGSGEATFFLDAVEESKIRRDDDFFMALDSVKKAVGPALRRSRFVISSRISEWRPLTDQGAVIQRLGVDQNSLKLAEQPSQSLPTGRNSSIPKDVVTEQVSQEKSSHPIMVMTLLPLTPSQVERYAVGRGVSDPQKFIAALKENNAWSFAGRPLDVELLFAYWNDKGHLSNLTDLMEYMVGHLLSEVPNKEKQDLLTPEEGKRRLSPLWLASPSTRIFQRWQRITAAARCSAPWRASSGVNKSCGG